MVHKYCTVKYKIIFNYKIVLKQQKFLQFKTRPKPENDFYEFIQNNSYHNSFKVLQKKLIIVYRVYLILRVFNLYSLRN